MLGLPKAQIGAEPSLTSVRPSQCIQANSAFAFDSAHHREHSTDILNTPPVIWQHGTYKVNSNGTITTDSTMFAGDGRVQVQVSGLSLLALRLSLRETASERTTRPDIAESRPRRSSADLLLSPQNACAAQSSAIYYYQENNLFATWAVSTWRGKDMLRLGSYDGSLLPRMYKISDTPRDYMFDSIYLS
jgi:hypothetical protein